MRRCTISSSSVTASSGIAYAAASSVRTGNWKNRYSCVVTTCVRAGISKNAGVPNSASASRNDMMKPAMIAGVTSGSVIERIVRHADAPSVDDASSSSTGSSSSPPATNVNVYGTL